MIRSLESIVLSSENPKELAEFYRDSVGLEISEEFEGDDGGASYEMKVGQTGILYINNQADLKGNSKDPKRIVLNFEVEDIEKAVPELDKNNVKKIEDIYHLEGYGLVSSFEDPDGNCFQLVQVRPTPE